jgi:hypothetical protein
MILLAQAVRSADLLVLSRQLVGIISDRRQSVLEATTEPIYTRPNPEQPNDHPSVDGVVAMLNTHNPAAGMRDTAHESAKRILDPRSRINLSPSDTL